MPSIQTLIGKRFEEIIRGLYPGLAYVGNDANRIPDFEHPLFYAEAKVSLDKPTFTAHLKQYQIESFRTLDKPVLYLIGLHDFSDSMKRLAGLNLSRKEEMLRKDMNLVKLYIVDNDTITKIWSKRHHICQRGHIHDCTLREGHLRQIIDNSAISVSGQKYSAREYYDISSNHSFRPPMENKRTKISTGYIMPSELQDITDYFCR